MKSQSVWMLLVSLLLCGMIGCGEKAEPVAEEPKTMVEKPKTVVSKPDVAEEPGSPDEITNSIGMKLKLIPAGEFLMGSPDSASYAGEDEKPQHRVRITKPFCLGVHEVTLGQYERVMGNHFKKSGLDASVDAVSWDDAQEFCRKLTELADEKEAGRRYRLPTEAEWEYACRAGSAGMYSYGDDESRLDDYAWYSQNSDRKTHQVGQKKPNAWGLYDMHGNVSEWCADWYDSGYYANSPTDDPAGPATGSKRVVRDGGWTDFGRGCRSASRHRSPAGDRFDAHGFRVAAGPSGE